MTVPIVCSTVHGHVHLMRVAASQLDLCVTPPGHILGIRLRAYAPRLLMLHGERLGSDSEPPGPFHAVSLAMTDGCCSAMAKGPVAAKPQNELKNEG